MARQARVATGVAGACCYPAQGSAWPGLRRRSSLRFVAGVFVAGREDAGRVLDAVAGMGALSVAFLWRWLPSGSLRVVMSRCQDLHDSIHSDTIIDDDHFPSH